MPTMGIRNAIWWVFVGTGTINRTLRLRGGRGKTWGTINKNNSIAISTMRICNAILWNFVGTGTINRPLRLRGGRGKTWVNVAINNKMGNAKYINEHIMCGLFIAHIYINEHSAIFIYYANVWQRALRKE